MTVWWRIPPNPLHRIDLLPAARLGPEATTGRESALRTVLHH